jgi:hypothetical protein
VWEACSFPNIGKVELGSFFRCDCLVTRAENSCFTKAINNHKKGVVSFGQGEVYDEVHGNYAPDFCGDLVWF